jgi:hypothetical protein
MKYALITVIAVLIWWQVAVQVGHIVEAYLSRMGV